MDARPVAMETVRRSGALIETPPGRTHAATAQRKETAGECHPTAAIVRWTIADLPTVLGVVEKALMTGVDMICEMQVD